MNLRKINIMKNRNDSGIMKKVYFFILPLIVSVFFVHSQLVTPLTVEELVRKSDIIVHGIVVSKDCEQDAEGRIFTKVQVKLLELLKGSSGSSTITVVHGGGVKNGRVAASNLQVELNTNEEVVLFLRRNERGDGVIIGMVQGKFSVYKGPDNSSKYVFNAFYGVPPGHAGATTASVESNGRTPLKLEELKSKIKEINR